MLVELSGGRYSICTPMSVGLSGIHTYRACSREVSIFGAICALMLIKGFSVDPLGPALLQFLFHDCDFQSLHKDFVAQWHPALRHLLEEWISIGATGDINNPLFTAHFATFHDTQVSFNFLVLFTSNSACLIGFFNSNSGPGYT
jgi:hypothetical protein